MERGTREETQLFRIDHKVDEYPTLTKGSLVLLQGLQACAMVRCLDRVRFDSKEAFV